MSKKEVSSDQRYTHNQNKFGPNLKLADPNEAPQISSAWKNDSDVSKNLKSSEECCLYDSGRADSGFLSGANIHSDQFFSGDLTDDTLNSSFKSKESISVEHKGDSKSYMRLDSGVDVGLNSQFSELSLKDDISLNDLNSQSPKTPDSKSLTFSNINAQFTENVKTSSRSITPSNPQPTIKVQTNYSWEIYFQQDEDGDTQLHIAIIKEFIEVVYSLVRMVPHPSYLDIRNDDCQTPLHLAVLTGQSRMVRLLLCGGAAADIRDRNGNTALHLAVAAGDISCVRALIEPINVSETDAVELRYNPYSRYSTNNVRDLYNYDGLTCVHLAALNGFVEILRYLVWSGANINARECKAGRSALHLAIERRDEQMCIYLLTIRGIDLELETYAGATAYQLAARIDLKLANQLIELGVDTYLGDFTDDEDDDDDDEMLEDTLKPFKVNEVGMVNVSA
uniref:Uncharacterized protein n=1 Tax=Clastoptera arizonana TaxID=38151 RepID=A0A1B6E4R3_9HEMI